MEKRNTIQKKLILDAVEQLGCHPTAEEVYAAVAEAHPTVSKATVYRNLAGLSAEGQLRHIRMPGGAARFDATLAPHFHIECTRCGCICDAMVPEDAALNQSVEQATGFTGATHDIVFYGLCPQCSREVEK
jgi:Fur family peroxide stress response transcriptional regulator